MNLFSYYKTNFNFNKFTKALTALAFVDHEKIKDTFNDLINLNDFPQVIRPLYNYFFQTYIGTNDNVRFPIKIWNHYRYLSDNVPKTNNAIEGFHNVFNSTFGTSNYNFYLLIQKIKEEENI